MQNLRKTKSFFILAAFAALGACGDDGTTSDQFGLTGAGFGTLGNTGLYVVSSTPAHNQTFVGTGTSQLSIRMNEPAELTSVQSNVHLIKRLTGEIVQTTKSVTGELINLSVACTTSLCLADNTDYEIQLFPGLTAVSGNTLLQGQVFQFFYIDFSTGSGGLFGNSIAGAPYVVSARDFGGCAVAVTFSESLAYAPLIWVKYDLGAQKLAQVVPAYAGDTSVWIAYPPAGSSCIANVHVTIYPQDYADLSGEQGTSTFSRDVFALF